MRSGVKSQAAEALHMRRLARDSHRTPHRDQNSLPYSPEVVNRRSVWKLRRKQMQALWLKTRFETKAAAFIMLR